jgi:hypothetical protein
MNQHDTRIWVEARQSTLGINPLLVEVKYLEAETGKPVFEDIYVGLLGTDMQQATLYLGCQVFDVTESSTIAYERLKKKYCVEQSGSGSNIASQPGMYLPLSQHCIDSDAPTLQSSSLLCQTF